jgi:hypothetical protein
VTVYAGERLTRLEQRIGRRLTAAERHMQVEQIDDLLNMAKGLLEQAIRVEQERLATHVADYGGGGRLEVTARMRSIIQTLRQHGLAHAANELHSMGYPVKPQPYRRFAAPGEDELVGRLRARLGQLTVKVQLAAVGLDLGELAVDAIEKALMKVLGARAIAADLVAPAFTGGLAQTFEQHADLVEKWQYTAVLDAGLCDPCAGHDGEIYDTLDELFAILPDFGQNPDCDGGTRCRCRALPVPPTG